MIALEVHHCIHCGTESQPSWRFCRRCGTALENLAEQPPVAACSNCSTPVAEGWRFCLNCGTGTDTATAAAPTGLTEDDVADLIAAPAETVSSAPEPAQAPAATGGPSAPEAAIADVADGPDVADVTDAIDVTDVTDVADVPDVADVTDVTDVPDRPSAPDVPEATMPDVADAPEASIQDVAEETAPGHTITSPSVSFEPSADAAAEAGPEGIAPPAQQGDVDTSPPPPPPDPLLHSDEEIVAAKSVAEAPPAAPPPIRQPAEELAEIVEPVEADEADTAPRTDPFAASAATNGSAVEEAAEVIDDQPAVVIPSLGDDEPKIRREVPKPLDAPDSAAERTIPTPIGLQTDEPDEIDESVEEPLETPADRARRPQVAVPEPIGEHDRQDDHEELPPVAAGHFRNPGLVGQGVQVALLITAAIAVAMIVALIVLNNRLDAYATTGESLARVDSAESMVNTWMRPLMIGSILLTYAAAAAWGRRIVANLTAFGNEVEEAALWMWMVPGANMWILFRHYDLGWKGADARARGVGDWKRGRPDWWTVAFVALPILAFVLIIFAAFKGADTFESAIDANAFSMVGYALLAFGLLSGVRSITNIIARQRSRSEGFDG